MRGSGSGLLLARKRVFGVALECFPAGLGQAGRSLGIQPERGGQGGHTRVFFLVPKGQAGYSSEVLVTEIKRNCYLNKSGLLETNKEKSLLYVK